MLNTWNFTVWKNWDSRSDHRNSLQEDWFSCLTVSLLTHLLQGGLVKALPISDISNRCCRIDVNFSSCCNKRFRVGGGGAKTTSQIKLPSVCDSFLFSSPNFFFILVQRLQLKHRTVSLMKTHESTSRVNLHLRRGCPAVFGLNLVSANFLAKSLDGFLKSRQGRFLYSNVRNGILLCRRDVID